MMKLLIFDMDGVLLKPRGYHYALKETVRLAGTSAGLEDVELSDGQIAQFEALGISSEWHSSALCLAVMMLQQQRPTGQRTPQPEAGTLDLDPLFEAIASRPMQDPPLVRGVAAVERLAADAQLQLDSAARVVAESESIQHSPTMNWFQELVLGSETYRTLYQKQPQFQTESYLKRYDEKLLSASMAEKVKQWSEQPARGAAIMTNRPSSGPPGFDGAPDAEMGTALVGLDDLPLMGYGEMSWLSQQSGQEVGRLTKPAWPHALSAVLAASGWTAEDSLTDTLSRLGSTYSGALDHLRDSRIAVFEDTPGGIVAVQETADLLAEMGVRIEVRKFGIAEDAAKQSALSAQGAEIYPDINQALQVLNDF